MLEQRTLGLVALGLFPQNEVADVADEGQHGVKVVGLQAEPGAAFVIIPVLGQIPHREPRDLSEPRRG